MTMSDTLIVYAPGSPLKDPRRLMREMFRDLVASRELAWRLFVRNINSRYRQSLLGYVWAVLPPIFTTGVFVFLKNAGFFHVDDSNVPYAIFLLTGVVLWQTFADALNTPLRMVTGAATMLTKVNFPREALILVGICEVMFSFIIRLTVLIGAIFWFGLKLPGTVLLLPFGACALIGLGITLGLMLTPLAVLVTDIAQGLPFVLPLWMFLTPVLYAPPKTGPGSLMMSLNPVSAVLDTSRSWLLGGAAEHVSAFVAVSGATLAGLLCAWILYRLALPILVERMSA